MTEAQAATAIEVARTARGASSRLAALTEKHRTASLLKLAEELQANAKQILEANVEDCRIAAEQVERGELSNSLYQRLKLDAAKLSGVIDGVRQVAALPDPIGKLELDRDLDDDLRLSRIVCSIGVILVIFEARPDALPQIVSLLMRTGNAGLLKGGAESHRTNTAIFECIERAAANAGFAAGSYQLIPSRHAANELLQMEKFIDLVIPRGSGELVRKIQDNTRIPVLGHAEGVCHLYVDAGANLDMAASLALDAKTNYPAACNSIETLLVHSSVAGSFIPRIVADFVGAGVQVRMEPREANKLAVSDTVPATREDWSTEYSDMIISIKTVPTLEAAIEHINEYGSSHTDCIVTEDADAYERFAAEVNSAGVFWNASTRFADGFRYGFGAEVGISTGKLAPRGPVGTEGLITYKYRLQGKGHLVANYTGPGARAFKHAERG